MCAHWRLRSWPSAAAGCRIAHRRARWPPSAAARCCRCCCLRCCRRRRCCCCCCCLCSAALTPLCNFAGHFFVQDVLHIRAGISLGAGGFGGDATDSADRTIHMQQPFLGHQCPLLQELLNLQFQRNVAVDGDIGFIRRVRNVRGGGKIRASGTVARNRRRCVWRPRGGVVKRVRWRRRHFRSI